MYCPMRECESKGWTGKCPNCKSPLQGGKPPLQNSSQQQVDYDSLVDIVKERGGTLNIQLKASEVSKTRATRFPWIDFGYAWTEEMSGECGRDRLIELKNNEVKKIQSWFFSYLGFGYAWVKAGKLSLSLT